jgi:hypothetical protein
MNEHGRMIKKVYCPECLRRAQDMHRFMIEIVESMKAKKAAEQRGRQESS